MYHFACVPLAKETEEHRSQFYLSFDLKCISFGAFKICAAVGLFFPLLCFVEFISQPWLEFTSIFKYVHMIFLLCKKFSLIAFAKRFKETNFIFFLFFFAGRGNLRTMDREAWWTTVHAVAKRHQRTLLSDWHFHFLECVRGCVTYFLFDHIRRHISGCLSPLEML